MTDLSHLTDAPATLFFFFLFVVSPWMTSVPSLLRSQMGPMQQHWTIICDFGFPEENMWRLCYKSEWLCKQIGAGAGWTRSHYQGGSPCLIWKQHNEYRKCSSYTFGIITRLALNILSAIGFIGINVLPCNRVEQRLHGLFHDSIESENTSAKTKYLYLWNQSIVLH